MECTPMIAVHLLVQTQHKTPSGEVPRLPPYFIQVQAEELKAEVRIGGGDLSGKGCQNTKFLKNNQGIRTDGSVFDSHHGVGGASTGLLATCVDEACDAVKWNGVMDLALSRMSGGGGGAGVAGGAAIFDRSDCWLESGSCWLESGGSWQASIL